MIDRKEEWDKNGEALFETVDVGVGEKDVGLEGGGECQRLQKMNFDYSVLSASKKLDKKIELLHAVATVNPKYWLTTTTF